ncbi:MAG: efflux RND transporter periplasmic adaptor subunit [Betaproteobacteria bacterium HGW-Betaproteobacteria-11]|nr:MAG: efflux RND transporter periplasmic adaptor subunit [Betaproteobacteria bacterium HGW-Betaproteobacteria-11]
MKFVLFSPDPKAGLRVATGWILVAAFFSMPLAWAADPPATVASVVVAAKETELTLPVEAIVEAVRQATVAAQISGRVVDMRVDAGQRVKVGEIMMRLDAREAAGSDAAARAALVQARAAYERAQSLHARKFISQAALDQAAAAWKSAQGSAGAAGATLSHAAVTAPISGLVAQRLVELGEMASPGRPLATVFDPKSLRVIATIPQYALEAVRKSRSARVEFPESGRWIDATRIEVLPTVDVRSHAATVRLYLPENAEGVTPGMAARAHFVTGKGRKLTLPPAAILRRGEITAVYVLDAKGRARLRQVRLGERVAGGEIEVLAGLNAGERVSLEPVRSGIELKTPAAP